MKRIIICSLFFATLSIFISCENDYVEIEESTIENKNNVSVEYHNAKVILNRGQTNALFNNGINPLFGGAPEKVTANIFGKTLEGIFTGDYFFPYEQLDRMSEYQKPGKRLFASTNRILLPEVGKRIVRVGAVVDGADALSENLLQAVEDAIDKYNALGMIKLKLEYVEVTEEEANNGADEGGTIDIVTFTDSVGDFVGDFDGRSTFPDLGNPGPYLGFSTYTSNYNLKDNTLLALHELGHCLGMAHADFLTRKTCGNTQPLDSELGDLLGVPGVSRVCNIAGTDDSGDLTDAVMTACGFFRYPTANFTAEDARSFTRLYSQVDLPCAVEQPEEPGQPQEQGQNNGNGEDGQDAIGSQDGEDGQDQVIILGADGEPIEDHGIPDINFNKCIELPARVVDLVVEVLGDDFYQTLISIGIICP